MLFMIFAMFTTPPSNWVAEKFKAFYQWLKFVFAWISGASQWNWVDAVMTLPLPANTYANGTSGAGATLTGNANGAFPTVDGVVPFLNMLVLVVAEATGGQNGYYKLTTVGDSGTAYVLTRVAGFDVSASMLLGTQFYVKSGTLHGSHVWEFLGPALPTVGTTALLFWGTVRRVANRGVIPSSRLIVTGNPTDGDVICTIGGKTFTCKATLVAATTTTQVKRGSSAAVTLASLINAINGVADVTVVPDTAPFALAVTADNPTGTQLRLRLAAAQGSRAVPGVAPSIPLVAAITGGPAAWTTDDLNETGSDDRIIEECRDVSMVTADNITATTKRFELPFTPRGFQIQAFSSGGVQRNYSDVTAINGDSVVITLGGGASPNLQANDKLYFRAWR